MGESVLGKKRFARMLQNDYLFVLFFFFDTFLVRLYG